MTNRDLAFFLLGGEKDYDAQQLAIRSMLRHRKSDEEEFQKQFEGIKEFARIARGSGSIQADMEYVDHLHGKVFLDAAHSMAAVGMLAPFIESMFEQAYYGIRDMFDREHLQLTSSRRRTMGANQRWNCHYTTNGKQHLINGIYELATATGLRAYLPTDLKITLEALFGYRNKNFHLGFEWPTAERAKFKKRISAENWPKDWFEQSSSGHKPWIFYLSDVFIEHCFDTIEAVMEALGGFYRERSLRKS
jgi:hypothetical protein